MRIKEFHVVRYGPIGYPNPFVLSDFTLFWGKNEHGKTLTIDALVKLLLGKETKRFDSINRVEGHPSGHVVMDIGQEQIKLSEKMILTDICDLSEAECRNIFIIRASDLSIERENKPTDTGKEAAFYGAITDRVTGVETQKIGRIKEAIYNLARITQTGRFKDIKDEGLKKRFEDALGMTEDIQRLSTDIQTTGFDVMEMNLVDEDELIVRLGDELAALEDARKREKYETGRAALEQLVEAVKAAGQMNRYRDADERTWRDAEREIERANAEIARLRGQLDKRRAELAEKTTLLKEKDRDFQVLDGRKRKIDEDVRPRLVDYERRLGRNAENTQKKGLYILLSALSAAVLCASLIGVVFRPHPLFFALSAAAFLGSAVFIALLALIVGGRARLERDFLEVRLDLARLELAGKSVPDTLANIQKFNELYKKGFDEINGLKQDRAMLEREIGDVGSRTIPGQESTATSGREIVADIQRRSGCRTAGELAERLAKKRNTESVITEQVTILADRFERGTGDMKADIELWQRKLSEFSAYRDSAPGVTFTERRYQEEQEEKGAAEERRDAIAARLSEFRRRLEQVERQANTILAPGEDYIYCETSSDLASIAGKLSRFVAENEAARDAAMAAVGIFEQIELEEKGRVSLLFDEGGGVSEYFSTITGGTYEAVLFDPADSVIRVRNRDGGVLSADKLSSGAYDQLYLAVRLALGQRIAPDGTGFFIMDDPFIRSDPDRLARQMAMLADIARKGWQIIYFSSKGEVKDALAKETKKGAVTVIDI